ncbi:11-beta-hydroxysteroid dehydrogenase 1b [Quercus suber]|uniref:11-beta-hydroxysteroid dehydrogenase 1b n=1 Tax=Quercus suber TaxID=58331 RepID=A0AAW0LS12_QUESU
MYLIHKFLNIVLLPLNLIVLLSFMPPFLILKFLWSLKRSIYSENVFGKVVLITGASSGIGEYAKRGARLALVARREDRLQAVADKARKLGSPEVVVVRADVSKVEECERFVNETVNHFGRLDHLVNNAGVVLQLRLFEDFTHFSDIASVMDINFWGSVHSTHYAVPHLRKSKGKIVVIASAAQGLTTPGLSFYNASKAAQVSFFETLRTEFGQDIGITIVTPGVIESEMTQEFLPAVGFRNVNYQTQLILYPTNACCIYIRGIEIMLLMSYEYAKRGARLALVARREDRLQAVADKARKLGSPEVVVVRADVSKVEECERFVNETVNHFGLDHLVNNAGVVLQLRLFEDFTHFSDIASVMDINFWGSVHSTHYAVPHLRKSKGKIVVIASAAQGLTTPGLSFYNQSSPGILFETLRTEFGQDIGITIVTPGVIESEMTQEFLPAVGFRNVNYQTQLILYPTNACCIYIRGIEMFNPYQEGLKSFKNCNGMENFPWD